jgi:hypothetical protein
MEKVKCKNCGSIGYTAAPRSLVCQCGGKFKVIPEDKTENRVELDEETQRFISHFLDGIDYAGYRKFN